MNAGDIRRTGGRAVRAEARLPGLEFLDVRARAEAERAQEVSRMVNDAIGQVIALANRLRAVVAAGSEGRLHHS